MVDVSYKDIIIIYIEKVMLINGNWNCQVKKERETDRNKEEEREIRKEISQR